MRSYRKICKKCILGCAILCLGSVLFACSDLVGGAKLPDSIFAPGAVRNEAGAIGFYNNTLLRFAEATSNDGISSVVFAAGLMTDELTVHQSQERFPRYAVDFIDSRLPEDNEGSLAVFMNLNKVRGAAQEGRAFLRTFAPKASPALQGHLLAIEGMANIVLAELFCSGIPLSSIDFDANYTLTQGFSTEDVYHIALSQLDSADVYLEDSVRLKNLVQLVRGRVLISLGKFEAAKDAVHGVETSFRYTFPYAGNKAKWVPKTLSSFDVIIPSGEGGRGLPFGTFQDPRTTLPELTNPTAPLVVATGIEARLIEAEAALSAGQGEWLNILNQLRTTCTDLQSCSTPAPPGSGGIGGLPPLTDPAPGMSFSNPTAKEARVRLLFDERAYWLFLTGRRQGDLRRLVRWYGYSQEMVYPSGRWGLGGYGDRVVLSIPQSERDLNPLYKGCQNYDA